MPRVPFEKELFYSSCLDTPKWIDDAIRKIQEQQELAFRQEVYGVPQIKINMSDIDYFKQPWVTCDNYIKPFSMIKLEKETNKMEAKKCDRCGKLYEKNEDRPSVRFKFKEVYGAEDLKKETIAKRQQEEAYIRSSLNGAVDLCPDCIDSFKKWWESDDKK